jgi:hypothetical protein
MSQYCDIPDLYTYGLPHGALPNAARLIDAVSIANDSFTLDEHGFVGGELVSFRPDISGTLPTPLVEGVTYYALRVTSQTFKVEATVGAGPINLGTTGKLVLIIAELPLLPAITAASALIEDMLPGHVVPLIAPFPEIIRMTCAELAVGRLMTRQGATPDSMGKAVTAAQERLKRWSKGIPIRGTAPETRANLAASASLAYRDPKGWRTEGVL